MPQYEGSTAVRSVGNNRYLSGGIRNLDDTGAVIPGGEVYSINSRGLRYSFLARYYMHIQKYPEAFDLGYRRPDRWYTDDYLPLAGYDENATEKLNSADFLSAPPLRNENKPAPLGSIFLEDDITCLLYTSPSPRDLSTSRMPSSA